VLLVEDLRNVLEHLAPSPGQSWELAALRDRALLLVGFAALFVASSRGPRRRAPDVQQ
jgi:hypothetical protein